MGGDDDRLCHSAVGQRGADCQRGPARRVHPSLGGEGSGASSGTVSSFGQREAARRLVAALPGVQSVQCDLSVQLPTESVRDDGHIERAAQRALDWNRKVPGNVQAHVRDAWIELTGLAATALQREAAEDAVRHVTGVRGVTNAICLAPIVAPFIIRQNIEAALGRHAARSAQHLEISIDAGVVTVRGQVDCSADREAVLGAARSTPGVTTVHDALQVGERGHAFSANR